jgi:hypothetical protein
LLARDADQPVDVARLRKNIASEPFKSALRSSWRVTSAEGVLSHFVADAEFARQVAATVGPLAVNTDDRNLLEFGVARTLGRPGGFSLEALHQLAGARGRGRPEVTHGSVDWRSVDDAHVELGVISTRGAPTRLPVMTPQQKVRFDALSAWARRDMRTAAAAWQQVKRRPGSLIELAMLTDVYATLGDDKRAEPLIEELAKHLPGDAAAAQARLHKARKQPQQAFAAIHQALIRYRTVPWATYHSMRALLAQLEELAKGDAALATQAFELLAKPFAVSALELDRRTTRLNIAMLGNEPGRCVEALRSFEPYPLWNERALGQRALCYQRAKHPLAQQAEDDLADYMDNQGMPVDALLPNRAAP